MGLLIFLCFHPFIILGIIILLIAGSIAVSPVVILIECLKKIFGPKVAPFVLLILVFSFPLIFIPIICNKHEPHPDYNVNSISKYDSLTKGAFESWNSYFNRTKIKGYTYDSYGSQYNYTVYGLYPYCAYTYKRSALCMYDEKGDCESANLDGYYHGEEIKCTTREDLIARLHNNMFLTKENK